jgi:hypothetical protein
MSSMYNEACCDPFHGAIPRMFLKTLKRTAIYGLPDDLNPELPY